MPVTPDQFCPDGSCNLATLKSPGARGFNSRLKSSRTRSLGLLRTVTLTPLIRTRCGNNPGCEVASFGGGVCLTDVFGLITYFDLVNSPSSCRFLCIAI